MIYSYIFSLRPLLNRGCFIVDIQPNNVKPFFPGTLTVVDQACTKSPFPSLTVNPAVTTATPV